MAKLLLDKNGNMKFPTIIMSNKALEKLGTIPYDYSSFEYTKYIGYSEGSFVVYKKLIDDTGNEIECRFWDDLVDLSVVYIREFNEYFEVEVSLVESDSVNKTVTLTSLHVAELSQINAYVEINTEEDIDRDDYLFPTVFYNPEDPTTSMLNRLLDDKAPHYSIGTVPVTLRNIQRTFSWSGTSIWDAFGDIEEEVGCKFLVQGRIINVVDMMTTCNDCGYRGDFLAECPKCSGTNVTMPYGDFTNIYVSRENLSEDITLTTEDQNMKNCFRLEAGDEDMTAAVVNLNPSGSRYIYHFSDKMKERISSDLRTALNSFESAYESYRTRSYSFDSALSSAYDALVTKYNDSEYSAYYYNDDNERVLQVNNFKNSQNIESYEDLISLYYDASGFYNYLNSTLMPSAEVDITTAQGQLDAILDKITEVGINNYDATRTSNETVASSIKMLCGAVLTGGFRINVTCEKTETEGVYDTEITVTNYSDDTDTATDSTLITISDDYELFFVQKMAKLMRDNLDNSVYNIIDFDVDDNEQDFINYLKHYDYNDLDSFSNAYSEAIDLFVQENNAELNDMETLYRRKYALINTEMALRESEVDTANDLLTAIEAIISNVKSALDLNTNFLTTKALQDEFNSYRREDSYDNSNFISDGLSDAELIARAIEFYDLATQEVENATRTVYNINATLHNLLLMPEFKDLWEAFEVCNWIAFRVDDKIFRLRILSYNIRYDENDITTIDVDFTTATEGKTASLFGSTQQILQSAKSMATSFPYIKYQTNVNKISVQDVNALTALLNAQLTNKNSEISSLTSSNIDLNGRLIANEIKADRIEADYVSTDTLEATEASINTLIASKASISDLTAATGRIGTLETNYLTVTDTLEAHEGRFDDIEADTAKIHNLTANQISAATGYIADLTSENITAQDLVAMNGTIENLDTNYAHITNGVIDNATISHADVDDLDANYAHITNGVIDNANIDVADVNNLSANYAHISNGVIDNANIDYADVNNLNAHYAEIDLANVNNAWIQDGVIKNAAISDAQIIGVSANKLTAGTIDASNITVTNLNASNITTGTINGQRIGAGSLSLDKLADDVYTESEVDALISGIQAQVDGAIETWTGSVVPTLNNAPASSWTDNDTKANHVGDIYYVVNAGNQADGYCYRFAYDSTTSTYSWVLIKDSDVTAALQRLLEAEGDIDDLETFQSTTSSWISNTDEELTSIKSNHTTLETTVNATIKSTTQLWFTKANTTAPNKPTAHVTSTSTNGNVWTKVVPEYNSSYPNYFYCYEWEYANGTYGWSDVVRDIGMGEVQSTARTASSNASTALTNAATAQSAANANIKSSIQLWYSKANDTYPNAPTSVVTSTLTSGGAWTTVVPTYNASYPYYFYCYQYQKGDNSYSWSNVVYDRATTETQSTARTTSSSLASYISSNNQAIADLQSQVDGQLEIWYYGTDPTTSNAPASSWDTNDLKDAHIGDLYYNTTNGHAWRWAKSGNTYSWTQIPNSDASAALAAAQDAQATADGKRKVFTATPTVPYDIGDLWVNGSVVKYATVAKTSSQTYSESDWSITSTDDTLASQAKSIADKSLKSTVQLWFTKANTTAPNAPTAKVTSTNTSGNAWRVVVPTYNASYPYYFYCYQYEASDETITWSDVVYDRATSESEERARTAITNASTAQTTANSNIKSVVQLWFTKANATAPSQPTAHVTTSSHSSYNTWNTVVPTYNEIYPYYYYCYEYQKGDGTYSWSDVVYDSATSENQKNSRDALSQVSTKVETSVFNTLSQTVEENSNSITSLSTTVEGKADSSTVTTLSNTVNTVSQTTNSNSSTLSNLTTRLGTNADGTASSTDIVAKESALEQDLNGFKSTVSSTYQTIDNMSNYSTTEQMNSAISQSASNITTTVSQTYATQASLNSEINQRKATYGTSSTDAGTATKAVTCENFSLYTGATVRVKFSKANTNATPSLNVNNTGAKAIKNFAGANLVEGEYSWKANATLDFVYDGTNWLLVDNGMTARVSSAESSISQNADNIELKVSKDGVISSINQSSESVTINANRVNIAGATIFTEGRLSETSLNNAYDAKGSASTAETNAKNYTDSIEIGGRNLYVNKDAVDGYLPSTGTNIVGMNSTNREQTSAFISVNVGEHYILQCWIPSIPSSSQAWLAYSFYTAQDLSTRVGSRIAKYGSNGVGYLAYNDIVIPDTVNYIRVSYRRFADGYIKLEKGTKPTDWSPAPEDVDASIDSAISTYDTNTVQATYATKANAIAQEQRVYYKSASSSKPASPTSSWVTKTDAGANTWTTYRMPYDQSYPYLYTCIQKQTVSGTITCTTVLLDDTTTVIDGGKIITGSVTANQLSADAIKSNNYVASSTSGSPYSSGGTFLDLSNGNIYTPNFGVQAASGTAYLNGEIIATSGTIGDDSGNYWSIGNTTDYEGDTSASIVANGTAYIQNGDWQISNGESNYSNGSINTQRYATVSGGGLQLTYPLYDNTYYDFGVTSPVLDTASSRYYNSTVSNNFLYIRKHASTIPSLASDWNYVFRVDKDGNAYVNNLYVNGTSIATMISDGVDGGAYLSTSGGTVNGDVTITGSLTATASRATADGSGNTITTTYMKLAGTQTNSGTNTFSGSNTFSGTTTISKANGLVYSGIQASSTNASTYVWFSKSGTNGTPVYDNDFKYNPSTNVLTVGSITGTAAKATADGSGNTITTTYATKANTAMTGNATAENLTVSGTLTATLTGNVTGNVSGSAGSLTTNAGSATQPIYFSDGVPVATTYALNKTVPSNAVFTDTNWYHSTGTWSGLKYTAGKSNNSMSALEFTIPTGTTATTVALGNHTHNYASKVTLAGTDYSSSSNAITITKANLQSAIQDTDLVLMTAAERSKLSSIQVSSGGTIDFSGVTASTPLTATVNSTNGTVNITHDDSGATAGTYRSVTVDAKGHVTGGTNPTTISGYGITDAKIASGVITLGSNTITPLTASSALNATKLSGTASISTTGNAGTATALASAGTVRVNLASTSAVTYTSGGNITPGVNGTLAVGNGGTGQTTAVNAANAFLNALSTGSTTPQDADYYISQYVGGGTTTTTYHRRPMSALWAYVKSKMGNDTSTLDGMYVKLSTAQTVGGAKTFSDMATFNSLIQANGNITIKGTTSNSTVYDASNPKITFLNSGGNQGIQLIYTDWDSVVSPASLTLVGEQTSTNGGERFIAPNVRVNNRFEYGADAYTTYNSTTKSIDFIFN